MNRKRRADAEVGSAFEAVWTEHSGESNDTDNDDNVILEEGMHIIPVTTKGALIGGNEHPYEQE